MSKNRDKKAEAEGPAIEASDLRVLQSYRDTRDRIDLAIGGMIRKIIELSANGTACERKIEEYAAITLRKAGIQENDLQNFSIDLVNGKILSLRAPVQQTRPVEDK